MSEGLIHMQNRISQAQKMRMLNKQTCPSHGQSTQTKLRKDTQNRLRKEFTKTQGAGTENNAEASSMNVTEIWNSDNIGNNKPTAYMN
jgi:hypothetical protein